MPGPREEPRWFHLGGSASLGSPRWALAVLICSRRCWEKRAFSCHSRRFKGLKHLSRPARSTRWSDPPAARQPAWTRAGSGTRSRDGWTPKPCGVRGSSSRFRPEGEAALCHVLSSVTGVLPGGHAEGASGCFLVTWKTSRETLKTVSPSRLWFRERAALGDDDAAARCRVCAPAGGSVPGHGAPRPRSASRRRSRQPGAVLVSRLDPIKAPARLQLRRCLRHPAATKVADLVTRLLAAVEKAAKRS